MKAFHQFKSVLSTDTELLSQYNRKMPLLKTEPQEDNFTIYRSAVQPTAEFFPGASAGNAGSVRGEDYEQIS